MSSSADAPIPFSNHEPSVYMCRGAVVLVSMANCSAVSLDGGMTISNAGLYPGLLLTGAMVLILLGFNPEKLMW